MKLEQEEVEHPLTQEKVIKWAKGVAAVIIATAAVTTAWLTLGLPIPATTAYVIEEISPYILKVDTLEEFSRGTRKIVLRQKQGLLLEEIRRLEEETSNGNKSPHIKSLIKIKQNEKILIDKQIQQIEKPE